MGIEFAVYLTFMISIPVKESAVKHHPPPNAKMLHYGKHISGYRLLKLFHSKCAHFSRYVLYLRFVFFIVQQELYVLLLFRPNTQLYSAAWYSKMKISRTNVMFCYEHLKYNTLVVCGQCPHQLFVGVYWCVLLSYLFSLPQRLK